MIEIRPVRILEDANNSLYVGEPGQTVPVTDEGVKDSDLLQWDSVLDQVRQNMRGSNRFSIRDTLNRVANDLKDLQQPVPVLENEVLDPIEAEGLRLLASSCDLVGNRPKITVFSNIPQRKKSLLLDRLKRDGLLDILDPDLPVLLRPNDAILPALFKLVAVGLFRDEEVYVVDDDPYIAELIRRGHDIKSVYIPGTSEEVVRKHKTQTGLTMPSSFYYKTPGKVCRGGAMDIYQRLTNEGSIKYCAD